MRRSRVRRLAAPLGALAGIGAAFAVVGAVDPNEPGHYPVCPLWRATGLLCPGCGGLRSAYAVAHGDLAGALGANALAVAGYAVCVLLWARWLLRAAGVPPGVAPSAYPGTARPAAVPRGGRTLALAALVMAFTVVRNLPFGGVLAP
ncbi:DUF2752 domain-containing protein [Streptomyces sp. LX-29]|uniref:DUF2752 domain-containing protein n=1 Tax=Streptomyces sp. LX-29 TaxID=2900152 RepID=UPI00240E28A6|nr:DUF2752 domain-containing protein [Streptomyces sp. LX-29]WFB11848.1 DUF2752 domain-containing protein [Streptomyces sp. LX-29]